MAPSPSTAPPDHTLAEEGSAPAVTASTGPSAGEPEVLSGALFADRYLVDHLLGRGGMGTVYAAHDTLDDDRPVALKVLRATLAGRTSMVARFEREAKMLSAISSEHVVRLVGFGLAAEQGPYLVLERLEGEDLGRILSSTGPLPMSAALRYVKQAALGVGQAHVAGLVHRDVKPSNLFLATGAGARPTIKVVDFGIARPEDATDTSLTATGEALGSPRYMSPEQVRDSRAVDARTDVWSLGVTLYELLTGALPFEGTSAPAVAAAIVADPPIPLRRRLPTVTENVERVVERCLAKDPNARFKNAVELAAALEEAEGATDDRPGVPVAAERPSARNTWVTLVAVAAALLLGVWVMAGASSGGDTQAPLQAEVVLAPTAMPTPTPTPDKVVGAPPTALDVARAPEARPDPPAPNPSPSTSAVVVKKSLPVKRATAEVDPIGGPLDDRK